MTRDRDKSIERERERESKYFNEWVSEHEDETDRRRRRIPIARKLPDPGTLRCFSDSFLMWSCETMKEEMKAISWWTSMASAVLMGWELTPTQMWTEIVSCGRGSDAG